jgi:kumamolisin
VWSIPSWQTGIATAVSATMRNVPDISLNSDQYTGYSIYYRNTWYIFGGTSCAAPLWAAFTARVNQQRSANSLGRLGFANPTLYALAKGSSYGTAFHDVNDGTTNLYYAALTGYDNSTGWGSFNGANMLSSLSQGSGGSVGIQPPLGVTASAGNATVALSWQASAGAASYSVFRATTAAGEGTTPLASGITATSYTDNAVVNGTTYYYTVTATDSSGTASSPSAEVSATPNALAITGGPQAVPGKTTAQVSWTTNLASTSVVRFGTSSGSLTRTQSSSSLVTSHTLTLTQLQRRSTYYYQVSSTAGSATATSGIFTFTTQ